jgi:hypothetical protein
MGPLTRGDEGQGWPLLRLCEVIAAPVAEVDGLAADTDTQVGWGPLLDPDLCPAKALPWLGQMIGVTVPVGTPEVDARYLVTHSPGWSRGTPPAVLAAARRWLNGDRRAVLTERAGGDAYAVGVTVYAAQVINLTALTSSVRAALPAGLSLTVTVLTGWTIAQMETDLAGHDIAYIESHWATLAGFETQIP